MSYKNIDLYIEIVNKGEKDGGQERTKAYPFKEDGVIIVKKTEPKFEQLKEKIEYCKTLGISIPAYVDYKINNDGTCWILEELAVGNEFATLVNNENGSSIVSNIPYEHIEKFFRDAYLLEISGIGIEPRRRNIFYDLTNGFTIIDVALLSNEDNSMLEVEQAMSFFDMLKDVLLVPFKDDESGTKAKEKTMSNIVKAFENSHPLFNKYKRWIFRGDPYFADFLKKQDCDLTLDREEHNSYLDLIEQLINKIVEEKIQNPEDFFNTSHISYIQMLEKSINYCPEFNLFNPNEQKLVQYIKQSVDSKIKSMFMENRNDNNLRKLYINIRNQEIDPIGIYDKNEIEKYIIKELEQYDIEQNQQIRPIEALKSSLETTSKDDTVAALQEEKKEIQQIKPLTDLRKGEITND